MYVAHLGVSPGGMHILLLVDEGDWPLVESHGSCKTWKMMLVEVSVSRIADFVVACPLAQFSCCGLTMPERWMCDI